MKCFLKNPHSTSNSRKQRAEKNQVIPDLRGVEVYIMGVDRAGKDVAYWQTLRDF
jgi:hypothetical protein